MSTGVRIRSFLRRSRSGSKRCRCTSPYHWWITMHSFTLRQHRSSLFRRSRGTSNSNRYPTGRRYLPIRNFTLWLPPLGRRWRRRRPYPLPSGIQSPRRGMTRNVDPHGTLIDQTLLFVVDVIPGIPGSSIASSWIFASIDLDADGARFDQSWLFPVEAFHCWGWGGYR